MSDPPFFHLSFDPKDHQPRRLAWRLHLALISGSVGFGAATTGAGAGVRLGAGASTTGSGPVLGSGAGAGAASSATTVPVDRSFCRFGSALGFARTGLRAFSAQAFRLLAALAHGALAASAASLARAASALFVQLFCAARTAAALASQLVFSVCVGHLRGAGAALRSLQPLYRSV